MPATAVCNNLDKLKPDFRLKVEHLLLLARQSNLKVMVFETYRSPERQLALYNAGKSKLKKNGNHGKGLAADIVFVVNGGPNWAGDWDKLALLGKQAGLKCGHYWKSFKDSAHFEDPEA